MTFTSGDYQPDIRDEILHRAHIGELRPEEAEAEAQKAGVGPLATDPSPDQFDPMKEPYWTLAMALAWIIWKEPNKVRSYWNDYRRECWVWREREHRVPPDGQVQRGSHLEQEKLVSLHDVWKREAAVSERGDETASTALAEFWKALETGALRASGIRYGKELRHEIPPFEWIDLSSVDYAEGRQEAVFSNTGALRFEAVRVARTDVEAIWPAPPSSAKAAKDCKAFLIEKMKASPTKRTLTNKQLWNEARAEFPRLSKRQYYTARAQAIVQAEAPAWAHGGAPKRKPIAAPTETAQDIN